MSGYNTILRMQKFLEQARELGFMVSYPRNGHFSDMDQLALRPTDDNFPIYSRDTDLFVGSMHEAEIWLRGVIWARDYDRMLKVSNQPRRDRCEQNYRNGRLVNILSGKVTEEKI